MSGDTVLASGQELQAQELQAIVDELPEINLLSDATMQQQVASVWARFLQESTYSRIEEAPAFPGVNGYDLARHTRQVVRNSAYLADSLAEFWSVECDRDALIAAALLHDASKLVEGEGPDGARSELGKTLLHAQLSGVRAYEAGLPTKVAYMITYHPFTPPHIHVKPRYLEFLLLTYADLSACDPPFFLAGKATHLDIEKRFFSLD
jgi:hypothetical protein